MKEKPIIEKCCLEFSLQTCLHTAALLKIVADLVIAGFLGIFLLTLLCFSNNELSRTDRLNGAHKMFICIIFLIVDMVVMCVLTIALCAKSLRSLYVFYYYNMFLTLIKVCIFVWMIVMQCIDMQRGRFEFEAVTGVSIIIFDMIILVTAKSEIIKMQNREEERQILKSACARNRGDCEKIVIDK